MTTQNRTNTVLTLAAVAMVTLVLTATSANAESISVASYAYGANPESVPQSNFASLLDPGTVQLADGVIATNWNTDPNVGFRNDADNGAPQPRVTFDLGELYNVATVDIWSVEAFGATNESVSISSSTDGVAFSAPVVVNPIVWTASGNGDTMTSVDLTSLPAGQFYQVDVFDPGQWMMLSEFQFDGTSAIPEPSTFILAALGLLGLMGFRRRRK
jgi:hypothetical protein